MMRSSVVFCLAVSFAMFGFAASLQCLSCPDGSSTTCEVQQDCNQPENSCLKLVSGETTYTRCIRHAHCDFRALAAVYIVPNFTFECCQSDLCNQEKKGFLQKLKDMFS